MHSPFWPTSLKSAQESSLALPRKWVFDLQTKYAERQPQNNTHIHHNRRQEWCCIYAATHRYSQGTPSNDIFIQPKGFSVETYELISSALINTYAAASASKKVISSLADVASLISWKLRTSPDPREMSRWCMYWRWCAGNGLVVVIEYNVPRPCNDQRRKYEGVYLSGSSTRGYTEGL